MKRHQPVRIDQTAPVGPKTKAPTPMPVTANVVWGFLGPTEIDEAWAIAWTKEQVLVMWFDTNMEYPECVWLRADQVRRR